MSLVQWNNDLSVGVAELDRHHQKLVTMLNELNDAMRNGKGVDVLGKILDGLISYTETHFAKEETYFDKFGYPDAAQHKQEHADLVKNIVEFKENFDRGARISIDVMHFLSSWLTKHIKGSDKKYTSFFNEKGLK